MKKLVFFLFTLACAMSFATDMGDVLRICQAAMKQPENQLMYNTCENILNNVELNKTRNQFSCDCVWNMQMTVVTNGKMCEYRCNCECEKNQRRFTFDPVTALSQEVEMGSDHGYVCKGQVIYGSNDVPVWKRKLIGTPFKINTVATYVRSFLVKEIDQLIACQ